MDYIIIGIIIFITLLTLFLGYKVYSLKKQVDIIQTVLEKQGKSIHEKIIKNDIQKELEELDSERKNFKPSIVLDDIPKFIEIVEEKPVEEKPVEEKPVEEKPEDETFEDETFEDETIEDETIEDEENPEILNQ